MRALVTNVLGGLAIAAIVGGLTAWRTQAVMAEQLTALVERFDASQAYQLKRIDALQEEVLQIRRDFYPPRFGREARTSERGP